MLAKYSFGIVFVGEGIVAGELPCALPRGYIEYRRSYFRPFGTETRRSEEGLVEIKASGEENRVMVAKDRPCQPELTDLLGILQVHGVQGPR